VIAKLRDNVSPWRRHGKRDTWIGQKGDPITTAPGNDPQAIAVALKKMLRYISRLPDEGAAWRM